MTRECRDRAAGGLFAKTAARTPRVLARGRRSSSFLFSQIAPADISTRGPDLTGREAPILPMGKKTGKKVALTMLTMQGFNIGKTPLAGTEKPAVSGVGDEAYYKYFVEPRYEKIKVVDLDVRKGSAVFGVEVGGYSIDDAKAKAKTLALEVLAKM